MTRSLALAVVMATVPLVQAGDLIRFQAPQTLSFDDLVTLASVDPPPAGVQARLNALLSQPFVSNEATLSGVQPLMPDVPGIGRVLRVAEWNINREYKDVIMVALSDPSAYEALARQNPRLRSKTFRQAVEEARHLQGADVIVLNEVDHGVNRTGYRDVTRDIATLLHMNYVFATEFIELTPLYLGFQKMDTVDLARQQRASEKYGVDPKRYLGLEGSALLSRYPIRSARIVHLPEAYDWYHGEIGAISDFGKVERWTANKVFDERVKRQVRRGGRIMIIAELEIPGSSSSVLTMVCPHLEDYSDEKGRRKQMDFALGQIGGISTPVVMAGDLNTTGHNAAPLTAKREVKKYLLNYRFWVREVGYWFAPIPGLGFAVSGVNYLRSFHDPTAANIPIIASNHSRPIFDDIHNFKFEDGGRFLWNEKTSDSFRHKGRTLAVTDQRVWKGFQPTFGLARNYHGLVGTYKIDWIFVKDPAMFQPYRGRTLWELNTSLTERISDHSPTTVDLALPRAVVSQLATGK